MASLSLCLKVLLVSCGVLSMALLLRLSVPLAVDFSVNQAPLLWRSLLAWLRPPYLYVILNCIIITIAASSRFHYNHHKAEQERVPGSKIPTDSTRQLEQFDYGMKISAADTLHEQREEIQEKAIDFEDKSVVVNGSVEVEDRDDDEFVISRSTWVPPKRMNSTENLLEALSPAEKPLVSARFSHRKPAKASPEGARALRVSKPKRHETLENTWKTITEGRPMPLTRHLKKLDTFENYGHQENVSPAEPSLMKKSETFKDRTNYQLPPPSASPAVGKLRREPSLSQDELNRRVEAFITKFNEEMRLQRQESLNQYKEMISRRSP